MTKRDNQYLREYADSVADSINNGDEDYTPEQLIENALDIYRLIDSRNSLNSVILLLTIGGPHVELNTRHDWLTVSNGWKTIHRSIRPDICERITETVADYYEH